MCTPDTKVELINTKEFINQSLLRKVEIFENIITKNIVLTRGENIVEEKTLKMVYEINFVCFC